MLLPLESMRANEKRQVSPERVARETPGRERVVFRIRAQIPAVGERGPLLIPDRGGVIQARSVVTR